MQHNHGAEVGRAGADGDIMYYQANIATKLDVTGRRAPLRAVRQEKAGEAGFLQLRR